MSKDSRHPSKKEEALEHLRKAIEMLDKSLSTYPDDDVYTELRERVVDLKNAITEQWPLPEDDEIAIRLNWHVLMNVDDYNPELGQEIGAACVLVIDASLADKR